MPRIDTSLAEDNLIWRDPTAKKTYLLGGWNIFLAHSRGRQERFLGAFTRSPVYSGLAVETFYWHMGSFSIAPITLVTKLPKK
jgi:hypothetical protein